MQMSGCLTEVVVIVGSFHIKTAFPINILKKKKCNLNFNFNWHFHLLQPAKDVGLRGGTVSEGASGVRSDQERASPFGTNELRRGQRPGALHPHGGAVVHTRPALHGRLGHPRLQRQGRVSNQLLVDVSHSEI